MTFIGGGRACIGFKFSEMEMSEWTIWTRCSRLDAQSTVLRGRLICPARSLQVLTREKRHFVEHDGYCDALRWPERAAVFNANHCISRRLKSGFKSAASHYFGLLTVSTENNLRTVLVYVCVPLYYP